MDLDSLSSSELAALLLEMGIKYDPDRLAAVLSSKWPQVCVFVRAASLSVFPTTDRMSSPTPHDPSPCRRSYQHAFSVALA